MLFVITIVLQVVVIVFDVQIGSKICTDMHPLHYDLDRKGCPKPNPNQRNLVNPLRLRNANVVLKINANNDSQDTYILLSLAEAEAVHRMIQVQPSKMPQCCLLNLGGYELSQTQQPVLEDSLIDEHIIPASHHIIPVLEDSLIDPD